jgi:hypothetical protein
MDRPILVSEFYLGFSDSKLGFSDSKLGFSDSILDTLHIGKLVQSTVRTQQPTEK